MKTSELAVVFGLCTSIGFAKGTFPLEAWRIRDSPTSSQLNDVAYGNGLFVAVGMQNTILTSSNGINWRPQIGSTSTGNLFSVAFGGGWFVAGGLEPSMIQSSTDGIHWTNRLFTIGGEEVYGVTYANGLFVAVGRRAGLGLSYVVTSTDTIGWFNRPGLPTTNTLLAVTYASGQFVAVGERGTIITSPDSMTWTLRNSGTAVSLRAIVFHGGCFIAGGDGNTVLTSLDGVNWSTAAPPSFAVRGLASNDEVIVAVGNTSNIGKLHVSTDGLAWPGLAEEFPHPLNGIVFGPGTFVAVGDQGLIVQSDIDRQGATNEWTKPTSGYWEEPFWSLGELPSLEHGAIQFSNPGFKALAIGPNTTANFPESLFISNLIVFGSGNLLLLNYAGLQIPLRVHADFILGPGAALLSYYSASSASNFYVGGAATFAESSVGNFGTIQLGFLSPGELNISNAVISSERLFVGNVSGGAAGRVNQYGGTNQVTSTNLEITENSAYNLSDGTLLVPGANVIGGGPVPQLSMSGGHMDVAGTITLLRADALLQGGDLQAAYMRVVEGPFTQTAGLAKLGTLGVADTTQFRDAEYVLAGGTLLSTNVILGGGFGVLGTFNQLGGVHSNSGVITMWGILRTMQNHVQGRYNLQMGLLAADTFVIYGGQFSQSAGTNRAREILFDQYGRFNLTGGFLYSSNTVVSAQHGSLPFERSIFWQSNGIHTVENQLITEESGVYQLLAGTLITKLMDVRGAFHLSGGTLSTSNSTVSFAGAGSRETRPSSFVQSNGLHLVQNHLTVDAIYRLKAGALTASNITINPDGDLWLEGGNVTNTGRFTIYDGIFLALGQHLNLGKLYVRLGLLARFEQRLVATLDLLNGSTVLHFADSRDASSEWNGRLVITNWSGSVTGGGIDQVFVGATAQGLTAGQLERISFANPDGFLPGNYPASILASGEIAPASRPAINLTRPDSQIVLSWPGNYQLLTATNVTGPYERIMGASSPYTNLFTGHQRYFQLRSPP